MDDNDRTLDGNAVAGARVTFTAPADGPGGRFEKHAGAGSRIVRVKTDAKGVAVAPPFVANSQRGGYAVTATIHGSRLRTMSWISTWSCSQRWAASGSMSSGE